MRRRASQLSGRYIGLVAHLLVSSLARNESSSEGKRQKLPVGEQGSCKNSMSAAAGRTPESALSKVYRRKLAITATWTRAASQKKLLARWRRPNEGASGVPSITGTHSPFRDREHSVGLFLVFEHLAENSCSPDRFDRAPARVCSGESDKTQRCSSSS